MKSIETGALDSLLGRDLERGRFRGELREGVVYLYQKDNTDDLLPVVASGRMGTWERKEVTFKSGKQY